MNTINTLIKDLDTVTLTDTCAHYQSPAPGLPLLLIRNRHCEAVIALQGAQLLEYAPRHGTPLLWLSPNAIFKAGTAIRGGIPVCLPWFGVNQQHPYKPKHGFVRNRDWQLTRATDTEDGKTRLTLTLDYQGEEPELFEHPFKTELAISLGDTLELTLTTTNTGSSPMPLSWALHSYHPVADLERTQVQGLDGAHYLDNTRGLTSAHQSGPITFNGEVDRAYEKVGATQTIEGKPRISVSGENCDSAIVWNPGAKLAATISDIGADTYNQFVCVERGAAFGDAWTLAAAESRTGKLTITGMH